MKTKALAILAMLTLGAGCVEDDSGFIILQNQAPNSSCEVSAGTSTTALWGGVLDVSAGIGYYMNPVVENNLLPTTNTDNQPERNRLHMRRFDVKIDTGVLPGSIDEFAVPVSGVLEPGDNDVFAMVQVIRDQDAQALAGAVPPGQKPVITVKLHAVAERGGSTVESAEFPYPVTLCNGCLVGQILDSCPAVGDTYTSNACGLPQDAPVTCCKDTTGQVVCLSGSSSSK